MANTPITWRNITSAPDSRGAAALIQGAGNSLNAGLSAFDEIIKNREANAVSNRGIRTENNNQDFLNQLNSITTPEELAAARQSGALDTSQYGREIDPALARTGIADQEAELRRQLVANRAFEDATTQAQAQPLRSEFEALLAADKDDEATRLFDANADLFNRAGIGGELQRSFAATNKQEAEEARVSDQRHSRETAQNLLTESVTDSTTSAEARARYVQKANELALTGQLSDEARIAGLEQVEQRFALENDITQDQAKAHAARVADLELDTQQEIANSAAVLQDVESQFTVDPPESFKSPERKTIADATELAVANGWDEQNTGDELTKWFNHFKKEFGVKTPEESNNLEHIIYSAVRQLGEGDTFNDDVDKDGLDIFNRARGRLENAVKSEWETLHIFNIGQQAIRQQRGLHAKTVAEQMETLRQRSKVELQKIKDANKALKNLRN